MTEAAKMKAPAHYLRVDLDDPGEAEYWMVVLDAPRRELEAAIAAVGRDALEVRAWLAFARAGQPLGLRQVLFPSPSGRGCPESPPRT